MFASLLPTNPHEGSLVAQVDVAWIYGLAASLCALPPASDEDIQQFSTLSKGRQKKNE
jgi:hypothetical protein